MKAMANDDSVNKLVGLFVYHRSRSGVEGVDAELYLNHVAHTLISTHEEVYRLQVQKSVG